MLQTLADHCGGAIERLRIEDALRESQAQLARTESVRAGDDGARRAGRPLAQGAAYALPAARRRREPSCSDADRRPCPTPTTSPPSGPSGGGCVRGRDPHVDLETRWLRPDGRPLWMYLNALRRCRTRRARRCTC